MEIMPTKYLTHNLAQICTYSSFYFQVALKIPLPQE